MNVSYSTNDFYVITDLGNIGHNLVKVRYNLGGVFSYILVHPKHIRGYTKALEDRDKRGKFHGKNLKIILNNIEGRRKVTCAGAYAKEGHEVCNIFEGEGTNFRIPGSRVSKGKKLSVRVAII